MYSTPNSDFDDFASSPVAATSHSDQDDDDPSSFTASVVLFKGPDVSLFPAVGRHIASGLAASSSPAPKLLKTLDGAQFELPPHDLSYYEDGWLVTTKWSSIKYGGGEWNEWRINVSRTSFDPLALPAPGEADDLERRCSTTRPTSGRSRGRVEAGTRSTYVPPPRSGR